MTMNFTRFTLTQDGQAIGDFAAMELAVGAATRHAVDTGKPVTIVAHVASDGSREAIFNPDGTNDKIWNIDRGRPRLVFDGNRANLRAAIGDPLIRRKLGKALMANFNWPSADEIHLHNDFVPYSFFFREYRNGRAGTCGGLILHGQEDMSKAYYGIHT